MKVNENKNTVISQNAARRERVFSKKAAKEYKKVDDKMLRAASQAAYSEGLALLLMQGCPEFIAKEIERDFYDDKCEDIIGTQKQSSVFSEINKRYSGEEKYELIRNKDIIEENPELMKEIMTCSLSKKGQARFNGFECANLIGYADKINNRHCFFRTLIGIQNEDNSPMFSGSDICSFLENSDRIRVTDEEIKKVCELKDKNGKNIFDRDDCISILNDNFLNSLTAAILYEKAAQVDVTDDDFSSQEFFSSAKEEAKNYLQKFESYEENPDADTEDFVKAQIQNDAEPNYLNIRTLNRRRSKDIKLKEEFENYEIFSMILDRASTSNRMISCENGPNYDAGALKRNVLANKKLFKELMDATEKTRPSQISDEDKLYMIDNITKFKKYDLKSFCEYLGLKNAKNDYAFSVPEALYLYSKQANTKDVEYLCNIVDPSTNEARFSKKEIFDNLRDLKVKDRNLFEKNAMLQNENADGYRFSLDDCLYLDRKSKKINENQAFYEKLLNIKTDEKYRYSPSQISDLLGVASTAQEYPDVFDKLVNQKSGDKNRFSSFHIVRLMENAKEIKQYPEFFDKITSELEASGTHRFSVYDCGLLLDNAPLIFGKDKYFFDELYNCRKNETGSFKFTAHSCINLLRKRELIEENRDLFEKLVKNNDVAGYEIEMILQPENLEKVNAHKDLFYDILDEKNPFYSNFAFDGKWKIFSYADKIDKEPELWNKAIETYSKRKNVAVSTVVDSFLDKYYQKHPIEKPFSFSV